MKKSIQGLLLFSLCFVSTFLFSQEGKIDSLKNLIPYWEKLAADKNFTGPARQEFIDGLTKTYLEHAKDDHYHPADSEVVWVPANGAAKKGSSASTNALQCTNIDFESGNTSGWQQFNGFNPLTNATGCCNLTNLIDQTIMSAGTDPYGGFPTVFPGGGSFSLRLGSTATGGRADRIQQSFFVTPANANFTYRYAVVLNDPGHPANQQPRFIIEIIDTLGNQIPCTVYTISAASNIPGYQTSSLTANGSAVIFKNWTSVAMDLTPNIGQNVTIRFTAYDCGPSGHFAYAYIDGTCTNFQTSVADTTCPNIPFNMCGPIGFGQYIWNGPGVTNATTQCIPVSAPGVYTCQTVLVPGCPGPSFVHTLSVRPNPVLSFTAITNTCSPQYSFTSSSSIATGAIASYTYNFGDGSGTFLQSPIHNYPGPGAYNVKFIAYSDYGCRDSVLQTVIVYPPPTLTFSPPSHCVNTLVNFTNTSNVPPYPGVPAGSVLGYTWNLGNGQSSNLTNPSTTYTLPGVYTITLSAISDQGCITSGTQTLGIFPPPSIDFTANPLCDINGTSFTPITTSSISSGSVTAFFWDFGDTQTSTLQSPNHVYNAPGIYTITHIGVSNHNCSVTVVKVLTISPTPTIGFTTYSLNACAPNFTFTNTSSVSVGSISYTWNFGGANTTNAASPSYTFPGIGNYTVQLIGETPLGCSDTAYSYITIYPFPVVTLSVPASCESAIFTVTTTAVTGSVSSYTWDFGDPASGPANTSTLQSPAHQYPAVGNYTISLTVMSNLNCPATYTQQILVHPNPITTFNFFPTDACTPSYTFANNSGFAANSPPGNLIVQNQWNFVGLATSTVAAPVYNFPGPGIYTVNLTTTSNFNCTSSQSTAITIYPYPQASISVAPVCLNVAANYAQTVAISQNPAPGTVTSYTWNFGDGTLDNNLNPLPHYYLSSGTFPVSFSITSNQGCVTTATTSIVVYPTPILDFNYSNICAGSAITFSNASSIPAGYFISGYRWDFESDGIPNSVQPNPTHSFNPAGIYTVQLFGVSNYACRDSITKTITVYDNPKPAITSSDVCHGLPTVFSATNSLPGVGAQLTSYSWNLGNNIPVQILPNGSHVYSAPGTYTLQLTATNNFSCISTTQSLVTVHQMPFTDFTTTAACLKSANIFTNTSFIGSPDFITKYSWNFGNGVTSGIAKDTAYEFTSPGAHLVTLQSTSNKGCTSAKTITVVVHDNPIAAFSHSLVCAGDNVNFVNLSASADGSIASNQWDFEGDNVFNQNTVTPQFSYPVIGAFPVMLKVTSVYGCSAAVVHTIYSNPKVAGNFTTDVRAGCPELCVKFSNLSSIIKGGYSSSWDFGDGSSQSGFANPNHCYGSGSYDVKLTLVSDSGCKTVVERGGFVTVYPNPVANFQVIPDEIDEDDPTITINDGSSSDVSTIKYYISDGTTYGSSNFTHYIKNLEKKVKPVVVQMVQNKFGCSDTLIRVLDIKPAFALYVPNVFTPNSDGRNDGFQAKGVGISKFAMQIYDRWGHKVWETDSFSDAWDGSVKGVENAGKQDVYTWKAQVLDIMNRQHNLVGHVTLLR